MTASRPSDPRTPRMFDLGDVLTVTDGRLVSPRHMKGVYDILNFMTGDSLFTHQLPRAMRVCGPALLAQYPQLADVDRETTLTPENFLAWLDTQKRLFGESLAVTPLAGNWTSIDPMLELQTMVDNDRIITVESSRG